jgi:uncharacterized phage-associated protein
MQPPYSAVDVAKRILAGIDREAGDSITHLKLQKLVYYAQAWSLALRGRPLFAEEMQAWPQGPVAVSVYRAYAGYGREAIPAPADVPALAPEDAELVEGVLETYGDCSAKHLEAMTHSEDPWLTARGMLPDDARSSAVIAEDRMAAYYRTVFDEARLAERCA